MSANNQQVFNAALAGFMGGVFAGRSITDATAGDYAAISAAAAAFATAVDAQIPTDASIVSPLTAYSAGHCNLVQTLCEAAISGRYSTFSSPNDYTTVAAAIAAAYTEAKAQLA